MPYHYKQGPFRAKKNLILASASPRRQELLMSIGLHFEITPSKKAEAPPQPEKTAVQYVLDTAASKAKETSIQGKKGLIIAADTAIILEEEILGKPQNPQHALHMLKRLRGRTHRVITGCFLLDSQHNRQINFSVQTEVVMSHQADNVLESYVATQEPLDKAGGYAIQGSGGFLVKSIYGSYSNVVGLPLNELLKTLLDLEAIACVSEIKK